MPQYTFRAEGQFPHGETFANAKQAREYAYNIATERRVSVAVYNGPSTRLLGEYSRYGERVDIGGQTQDCARGEHMYVTGRRTCPLCGHYLA